MLELEPHKVLVGVDAEADAESALRFAAREAVRRECGVHVVHVLHPLYVGPPELADLTMINGELRRAATEVVVRASRRLEELVEGAVPVSTEIVHGTVVASLVECSEHASLVVLQHQEMGQRRHHIGTLSITNGVAARAHAPVVAVPDGWLPEEGRAEVISVGVETLPASAPLVRAALGRAAETGARVRLVHAWWFSDTYDDLVFAGQAGVERSGQIRREVAEDLAVLLGEHPDVPTQLVVEHAHPADALVLESREATLVVVGRHDPKLPLGSHLGPITRAVLDGSTCPVLVVAPHPRARHKGVPEDTRPSFAPTY